MLLPIAALYNEQGGLSGIRYLKFADNTNNDFNQTLDFDVNTTNLGNTEIITIEADKLPIISGDTIDITTGFPYRLTNTHYYTTGIWLPNIRGISIINAEGNPVNTQFCQVICTKHIDSSLSLPLMGTIPQDTILYLVDYKGNILKVTYAQLSELETKHNITVGNLFISCLTSFATVMRLKGYKKPQLGIVVELGEPETNLASKRLADMSDMMTNPLFTPAKIMSAALPANTQVLKLPRGMYKLRANYAETPTLRAIKSIFCPEVLYYFNLHCDTSSLETLKCPEYMLGTFHLQANSIKQLILPRYIALVNNTYNYLTFDLSYSDLEHLQMPPSVAARYSIAIENAPNLKSLSHTIETHYEDKITEYIVDFRRCPNFKSLSLKTINHAYTTDTMFQLSLEISSPNYTIDLDMRVSELRLGFTVSSPGTIYINCVGIKELIIVYFNGVTLSELRVHPDIQQISTKAKGIKYTVPDKSDHTVVVRYKEDIQATQKVFKDFILTQPRQFFE